MKSSGPRFKVQFRRKREGKTDYRYRLKLLRSGKLRLVVRFSLKHVSAQIMKFSPAGDVVVVSAHSKQLKEFGWRDGTSNLPAAYLVGLLCGYRAIKAGVKEAILDIGMRHPTKGGKVFAVLKGAIDAGLQIPHLEEILPSEERISGTDISRYAEKLRKENERTYQERFSSYLAQGLAPEQIPEHFNSVKQEIIRQFGG
ncbi:MAG: 50S ribosomal protein L18 [Candidatus Hadarchaeum yellowstonense]|jgi:large subunit ribosomal protein L18|uniref:Large ribosomal subunit protein uL18 n=1 Tax=Hadarchaeum yellowstonense TaxID=1776334 RepID=A0A147JU83_HADYE|nr:MAG: 50S ribosomal protein L18 [Candidatus Hadarchaeum yellowstonense]